MPIKLKRRVHRSSAVSAQPTKPAAPPEHPNVIRPLDLPHSPSGPARTRGKRAGLTRATILHRCREALAAGEGISIAAVAKACGVAPNAIYSRFDHGMDSIKRELAREMINPLGRVAGPKENWEEYLQSLFAEADESARESPQIGRLVPPELVSDPSICPRLEERILYCLHAADVPEDRCGLLMFWIITILAGVFCLASTESEIALQGRKAWVNRYVSRIEGLPHPEFPMLHRHLRRMAKASAGSPDEEIKRGATTFAGYVMQVVAAEAKGESKPSS